jgi:hypothetical protein
VKTLGDAPTKSGIEQGAVADRRRASNQRIRTAIDETFTRI